MLTICVIISHSLLRCEGCETFNKKKTTPTKGLVRDKWAHLQPKKRCRATSVCAIHASIKYIHKKFMRGNKTANSTKAVIRRMRDRDLARCSIYDPFVIGHTLHRKQLSNRSHAQFPSLFLLLTFVNSKPIIDFFYLTRMTLASFIVPGRDRDDARQILASPKCSSFMTPAATKNKPTPCIAPFWWPHKA